MIITDETLRLEAEQRTEAARLACAADRHNWHRCSHGHGLVCSSCHAHRPVEGYNYFIPDDALRCPVHGPATE